MRLAGAVFTAETWRLCLPKRDSVGPHIMSVLGVRREGCGLNLTHWMCQQGKALGQGSKHPAPSERPEGQALSLGRSDKLQLTMTQTGSALDRRASGLEILE